MYVAFDRAQSDSWVSFWHRKSQLLTLESLVFDHLEAPEDTEAIEMKGSLPSVFQASFG